MRLVLSIGLTLLIFHCQAQRIMLSGKVMDEFGSTLVGTHVRNISSDNITVTNLEGAFLLPAQPGDTLQLSNVGFSQLLHVVQLSDFLGELSLKMTPSITKLNEVTILSLPTLKQFKELIMEQKVKDTAEFWYFGVAKPKPKQYKMESGQVHNKFLYALVQPTDFLYYNLSKKEKEKRKYYQIQKHQDAKELVEEKFTREWVAEQTGLEGEELTEFIAFCNFSYDYLNQFPLYVIREDMMEIFILFKK
jgi:hypothetical protein